MATTAQVSTAAPAPAVHDGGGFTTSQVLIWTLLIAAVLVIGWRISLARHPWRHCRKCDSNPRSYGTVFRRSFAICDRCGGSGRELRTGAKER
jgi:hypothetical protein